MTDWSISELREIVADYFAMLEEELAGREYNKTAHRNALLPKLNGRSKSAVEYKHQNSSAILLELGLPFIDGYKPAFHYQDLLKDVILEFVGKRYGCFTRSLERSLPDAPPLLPKNIDRLIVPAPSVVRDEEIRSDRLGALLIRDYDYAAREAYNHRLGKLGEQFAANFEQARLIQSKRPDLAKKVEWVARTQGEGLGYDIRSFETDGSERFIEVKTTRFGRAFPFLITSNEVRFSKSHAENYYLCRVFRFLDSPRLWFLKGTVSQTCSLIPKVLEASPKG